MIRTSLINGVINLDSDFSKYIESLSNPGVIEGFNVQDGVVKPGKARVKAERTNGETIFCYVENTEDVSLSGNDGKVYIVIDQEDIDSGLVSEDGSNIARIEEGDVRPVKNFLKIWSKNGGLIVDEREMVKKINEVDEDLEEEISGIDTRLTEAEHDIQQIIEQSGSALSYLDTTCYAGEEIHENDLIVTNGNSFNPDRADESTDVGGQTVNKYAIGFIGNGEAAGTFGVKSCVIEGFEPDSVTLNIESDDNGKPSGTAITTSSSLDFLKSRINFSTSTYELLHSDAASSEDLFFIWPTDYGKGSSPWQRRAEFGIDQSSRCYISAADRYFIRYLYDYNGSTYFSSPYATYCGVYNNGENVIIYTSETSAGTGKFCKFVLDGSKYVLVQESETLSTYREVYPGLSPDGKMICFTSGTNSSGSYTLSLAVMSTPYDLSTIEIVNTGTSLGKIRTNFIYTAEDKYVMYTNTTNSYYPKHTVFKINEDYSITSAYSIEGNSTNGIRGDRLDTSVCYQNGDPIIYTHYYGYSSASNKGYYFSTLGKDFRHKPGVQYISFPSFATEYGKKYRLTIAPVVTGSVVDSVKIYDKEGEAYSECAVRDIDFSHTWSNVSNKVPYISGNGILARYARKEQEGDSFSIACGGFANGDFTDFENVQYTFKGVKTGFTGLKNDTAYYSTGDGGIAKDGVGTYVGKAVNETSLLVNIDTSKGRKNKTRTLTVDKTSESTYSFTEYITSNETVKITGYGYVKIYVNGLFLTQLYATSSTTVTTFLFEGDTLRVTYQRYDTNTGCSATITFF